MDETRFKNAADKQQKFQLADNQCKASALQAGAGASIPAGSAPSPTTNVYVGRQQPVGAGAAFSQGFNNAAAASAARQSAAIQGAAWQERQDLIKATYVACMNNHGFIDRRETVANGR